MKANRNIRTVDKWEDALYTAGQVTELLNQLTPYFENLIIAAITGISEGEKTDMAKRLKQRVTIDGKEY